MVEGVGAGGASTAGTTRSSGLRAALTAPSSFRWHALGLLVILLALLPVIDNGSIGFVDEGVYAAQAANLADGSWGSPLVEPELNPDGRYNAVTSSATIGNSVIPYARQPLYPLILTPAYAVGGLTGLMLVSLAGTWIAALAGAGIARLLDARLAIPTLWLLGAGSPLLFDAYFMVGHSLVAAAAGVTAWAMLKAGRFDERTPPRAVWLVLAVPAAAVAVLLRSEGVLAVGLLGVAGAACSWTAEDRRLRPDWRRVTVSGSIAVTAIAAYKLNAMWAASITSGARVGGDVPRETDPVQVVWISLVQPWNADNREASVAMVIAVVATILGAVTLRLLPKRPLLPIALLFLAAAAAVAHLFETQDLISGLLAAAPVLVLGWLLLPRPRRWDRIMWILAGTVVTTSAIIIWTTYGEGGAIEWGGRFFHVLLPLAVPVALLGVASATEPMQRGERAAIMGAIAVTALALSVSSLMTSARYREAARITVDGTNAFVREFADGPRPLVLYAPLVSSGNARLFWDGPSNSGDVLAAGNLGGALEVLPKAATLGRDQVFIATTANVELFSALAPHSPDFDGWRVARSRRLDGASNTVIELARD